MKVAHYNRSEILSWSDLTPEQQKEVYDDYGYTQDDECSFVVCDGEALDLGMFMRADKDKRWHGYYGTSYFSAYAIRFNRSNDEALVARVHW